tara:strand:- start:19203 stop:19463 length:261 start_codon:yes stop_codon:yes gene_type:complete
MQYEQTKNRIVEFRLVDDDELPPIVITMDDEDNPKIIINHKYKVWLGLNRKIIGGVAESLYEKIDELLHAYLSDQRMLEKEFEGFE